MSKKFIKQRILKENPKFEKKFRPSERVDPADNAPDTEAMENILQENPNIFLLNNLLLAVQFFENYERDVEVLRGKWFKEFSLESHHKKCFYADSLFRESGAKVKFSILNGINKNSKDFLHPFRIYISSDNIEAAFDPANLGRHKKNVWPQYRFTVKMDENDEKSGSASLILLKTLESPENPSGSRMVNNDFSPTNIQIKSSNGEKCKILTGTERFFTSHNKELNSKFQERRTSLKFLQETTHGTMPTNRFYCFPTPEDSLSAISIVKYRMNTVLENEHEIPQQCFQKEAVETDLGLRRRIPVGKFAREKKVLNSAAFKGHFCDLLIEKLAEPLGFDADDVHAGIIHEEFAIFGQKMKIHITHIIEISDWNKFISLTEHRRNNKVTTQINWPTNQMWGIMNALPCYAVPYGLLDLSRNNLDHEKKWKIVFPKTEQFLLLHMMHSQIRCYFFILSIYKSFIEPEINTASLGPRHLLHLLFWQVHKNFLAWPDERPAETLLNYFKILYKKLQNKFLRDFFINSRNLFASSLTKDLHKAQALIKIILQNPVPYILRAMRNLQSESDFYPAFEAVKVNAILRPINIVKNKSKRLKKEKPEKKVCFENVEERIWRKSFKQMQSILKGVEQETIQESINSINTEDIINFNFQDFHKFSQILQILIFHYIEMGNVSIEFKFLTQALMYLFHVQSLFKLVSKDKFSREELTALQQKISELKEKCDRLEREERLNKIIPLDTNKSLANPSLKLKSQQQKVCTDNDNLEKQKINDSYMKIKILQNPHCSGECDKENDEWETKL